MGTSSSKKETETHEKLVTVYHATTAVNAASIIKSGYFRIPQSHEGPERGLKAGAAAYFGFNKEYCIEEAVNSMEDIEKEQNVQPRPRSMMRKDVVCLKVRVNLGRALVFSDYGKGQEGKGLWPIQGCVKLPSGKTYSGETLTATQWDYETEGLDVEYLRRHSYDSVIIEFRDDADAYRKEIAVYEKTLVKDISMT